MLRVKLSVTRFVGAHSTKEIDVSPTDNVGDVKRRHFDDELGQGCAVRFLYQGRVLTDLLTFENVDPNATILVHISRRASSNNQGTRSRDTVDAQGSSANDHDESSIGTWTFNGLVGIILAYVWLWRIQNAEWFDTFSQVYLIAATCVWVFAFIPFLKTQFHNRYTTQALSYLRDHFHNFGAKIGFKQERSVSSGATSSNSSQAISSNTASDQ